MPGISDLRQPMLIYDAGLLALRLLAVSDFGSGGGGGLTDAELRASAVQVSAIPDGDNPFKTKLLGADGLTVATFTDTSLNVNITGAGTADLATTTFQSVGNNSLSSIDGKTPALGQALAASSVPVILPSATITTLTPPAAITGFATSSKQDTGNTSLSSIDGKLTNPLPVSLPAATVTTLTPPAAITGFATSANQVTELASLALASTAALQTSGNASLTTVAALSKAEDAAAVDADTGIAALAVRQDVPQATTGATGDYTWHTTDAQGRLWVNSDILAELKKRTNDLLLTQARLASEQLRFQSMMAGGFVPVQEVW